MLSASLVYNKLDAAEGFSSVDVDVRRASGAPSKELLRRSSFDVDEDGQISLESRTPTPVGATQQRGVSLEEREYEA